MTDTLYFSADEVMKGIRLLYNEMDFKTFYGHFFSGEHHTDEYVMGKYRIWGQSPFTFWCSIDDTKHKKLNFLIDDCANRELKREKNGGV